MDDGSGFDDGNSQLPFDTGDFNLTFSFEKQQQTQPSGLIDPTLTTTMSPYATISAEAHFLTPPTTAPSPRSSSDLFNDHAGAGFGACPNMLMGPDPYNVGDFYLFDRPDESTIDPAATASQEQLQVNTFSQTPYPALEPLTDLGAAGFTPPGGSAPMPMLSSSRDGGSADTDAPSAPPPPPRRRGGGRPSAKKSDAQRAKSLERNRIAASKCRQKKKEWMQDLEDAKEEHARNRLRLKAEHWQLSQEIANLKNELMTHARCNDPNIQLWISQQAQNFVAKPSKTRTPLYPDHCHTSQELQVNGSEESVTNEEEDGEQQGQDQEQQFEFKTESDFQTYSASGLDMGSSSAMLPSPTESHGVQEPHPTFPDGYPLNLDYMPEELLQEGQHQA